MREPLRLLLMMMVGLTCLACGIGWIESPRNTQGHPLVLTRENLAIKHYLARAARWARELVDEQQQLAEMQPLAPSSNAQLPPSAPADLYGRLREVQESRERIAQIAREVERDETPVAMIGLHTLMKRAAHDSLAYANAALEHVTVPDRTRAATVASRAADAGYSLQLLHEALANNTH